MVVLNILNLDQSLVPCFSTQGRKFVTEETDTAGRRERMERPQEKIT